MPKCAHHQIGTWNHFRKDRSGSLKRLSPPSPAPHEDPPIDATQRTSLQDHACLPLNFMLKNEPSADLFQTTSEILFQNPDHGRNTIVLMLKNQPSTDIFQVMPGILPILNNSGC